MLGRLFNSASSTAAPSPNGTRPSTSHAALESDELHTRNLLYPDTVSSVASSSYGGPGSLSQSQSSAASSSSFGLTANIDLEPARDVRVIVAQDASSLEHKLVLFDSRPPSPPDDFSLSPPSHPACPTPTPGAAPPGSNAYGWPRRRSPQQHPPQLASGCDEELRMLMDCMFGVAPLAYKGPSTKVHILPTLGPTTSTASASASTSTPPLPLAGAATPAAVTPPTSSRRGSLREDRSTAAAAAAAAAAAHLHSHHQQQQPAKEKRQSVLITRLFSVAIPPPLADGGRGVPLPFPSASGDHAPTPTSSVGSTSGFPFPKITGGHTTPSSAAAATTAATPKLMRPGKSAMYAIGLIVSLPPPLLLAPTPR